MIPCSLEQMLRQMNDHLQHLLDFEASQPTTVLDIGCGYGSTALQLLQAFPNVELVGINANASEVAVANEMISTANLQERAKFVVADFQNTPFPDNSFDAAYALESACFAEGETKSKLVKEIARLLRPGGRFVVVDGFRKHDRPLPMLVDWLYQKSLAAWWMPSLAPIDGFEKALQKQGFEKITIKDISWNIAPSLAHIPVVAMKLFAAHLVKNDMEKRRYLQALLLTLALSPFMRHFGYYSVTCVKTTVESKK